jgi:hypothetical protein
LRREWLLRWAKHHMQIDENTRGSVAHQEAVGVLRRWILLLCLVNFLVCIMFGSYRGLSLAHVLWVILKSLIFSYLIGILLFNVAVRIFGRAIGIRRVYRVGILRYFVVLGCLSVAMGSALVYSEQPDFPAKETAELLNSQTEQWQSVKDAKVYCAKQAKTMILQKLDKADFRVTFTCI